MRCLVILFIIVPGIFCAGISGDKFSTSRRAQKALEDRLYDGLSKYLETGELNDDAKEAFRLVESPGVFRGLEIKREPSLCLLCKVGARLLITYRKTGISITAITDAIKTICVKANIENSNVCSGAIDLNAPIFVYIIDNKPDITPDIICSTIFQSLNCEIPVDHGNWTITLPPPQEHNPTNKQQLQTNQIVRNRDTSVERPLRILQITDMHFDELYSVGSNANCGEPLCCGSNQGEPKAPEDAAGNWGDYRSCDMPWHSVIDLMDQVNKHEFDYVYYTGDIVNHRVWATTVDSNIKSIKQIYREFGRSFQKVSLFPILGNHEPNPVNEFAQPIITQPGLTTQWLYDLVAQEWNRWLPKDALSSVQKGGYYTTLVRPGFRIVGLNSNVAYTFNWWLMYSHSEMQKQLQWLTDVLTEAEKNKEIVHILSHVPTGDNTCLIKWGQEYKRIVQRFSHVIAAQFVGHTHYDEMNLFFDDEINKPINVVFNGGSFTSYTNVNPNFVIYEVNPKTLEVEDYEQWIYNITEANKNSVEVHPRWYKLYSFKEAYGVKSMALPELGKLVQRMATNQTLLDQYYRFKMRDGDPAMLQGCDEKCHETNLCNLVTTEFNDDQICKQLVYKYRNAKAKA